MRQKVTKGHVIKHNGKVLRFRGKLKAGYPVSSVLRLLDHRQREEMCLGDFFSTRVPEKMGRKDGYEIMNIYAVSTDRGIYCEADIFDVV